MTYIKSAFQEFLGKVEGFEQLPTEIITNLSQQIQPWRYRIGQKIVGRQATRQSNNSV